MVLKNNLRILFLGLESLSLNLIVLNTKKYMLPDGKEFIRMDFKQ